MSTVFRELPEYPAPNPELEGERKCPAEVYDRYEHIREWARKWFEEHLTPSARGGFTDDEEYLNYLGFRVCRECRSMVLAYGDDDETNLSAHRAWHDKLNGV